MVAARAGRPRFSATASIVAAYAVWLGSKSTLVPAAVAWQRGPPKLLTNPLAPTTPAPTTPAASSTRTSRTTNRRIRERGRCSESTTPPRLVVGMQGRVQDDAVTVAGAGLDGAGHGVADEQQVGLAGQLSGLDHPAVGQRHLGARREVEPGLDHAVVTQRDAQARLGAEQAALADADPLGAA